MASPYAPSVGGDAGYLRIATEEAFAPPELIEQWRKLLSSGVDNPGFQSLSGFYVGSSSARATAVLERLQDLGERRLADMDATGIDKQIISLTAPGTQVFDRDLGVAMATLANDRLADACGRHPTASSGSPPSRRKTRSTPPRRSSAEHASWDSRA